MATETSQTPEIPAASGAAEQPPDGGSPAASPAGPPAAIPRPPEVRAAAAPVSGRPRLAMLARLRPRTIRARLSLAVAAVLALTLLALGVMTVQLVRATMLAQLDDQVREAAARPTQPRPQDVWPGGPSMPLPPAPPPPPADVDPNGRQIAVLILGPQGEVLVNGPSGVRERPDPAPNLPPFGSGAFNALMGRIVTLPSVDGTMRYRSFFQRGPRGQYVIISGSMRAMDETLDQLVRGLLLGGVAALAVSVLVSSWLIRRGLAPTSQMIETATAIAGGDLTSRVPDADPATELGQLGAALNEMLGQIERGIQARIENEERLRRFVADAAHELRTPLTSLRGYAELYQQGACQDQAAVDAVVHRIAAEGARMARLVNDLLLLARLDHQQGIDVAPVDLTALVRDALADFRVVHPDRPLNDTLDGPAMVLGDRGRLQQIVGNLLTNARTHTPPSTPVHVAIELTDMGSVRLTVADEGPGIAWEDQPYVFERFWRADPSRVRTTGGTGLGLAIVASLVQAHGGTIALQSTPGAGAAFTIQLPLLAPVAEIPSRKGPHSNPPPEGVRFPSP